MKKINAILVVSIIIITVIIILSFTVFNKNLEIQPENNSRLANDYNEDWGFSVIGNQGYDKDKVTKVKVAIIDTDTESYSFDGSKKIKHSEMSKNIIQKVAPNAEIKMYVSNKSENSVNVDEVSNAIKKAIDEKCTIINISLGTKENNKKIESIIKNAYIENKAIIVCSAGNYGEDLLFPANLPETISVASRNIDNIDVPSNSFSMIKKSVSAPGEHININGGFYSGSSVATPFVTGALAIIKGNNPNISLLELKWSIEKSCVNKTEKSFELIQIDKALEAISTK